MPELKQLFGGYTPRQRRSPAEADAWQRDYDRWMRDNGYPQVDAPVPEEGEDRVAFRARIPQLFLSARLENWEPDNGSPRLRCASYVAEWPPKAPLLLLCGDRGCGKTHLGCAILHEAYKRHGVRGQFWSVIDLMDRYRAAQDFERATESVDEINRQMRALPILVIDDLGVQKDTEKVIEWIYALVDWRYREMKPLIVTSNIGLMGLEERVRDRFQQPSVATVVQFTGPSKRAAS